MSADNGYVIRENRYGDWTLQMYFASDDGYPDVNDPNAPTYESLEAALAEYSRGQFSTYWSEYGLTVQQDLIDDTEKETKMQLTEFIRKPLIVEGIQVTEDNIEEVAAWVGGEILEDGQGRYIKVNVRNPLSKRQTQAYVTDWVLSSKRGFKVYTASGMKNAFDLNTQNNVFDQPQELFVQNEPVAVEESIAGKR